MRKLLYILLVGCVSATLSSCYAFLQADKLVYAGTLAKTPKNITIESDTIVTKYVSE